MRKRHQEGYVRKQNGRWIGQWRLSGERKTTTLGAISELSKSEARERLARVIAESKAQVISKKSHLVDYVDQIFLPFYRRKWKRSTAMTTAERIRNHITNELGHRSVPSITRDQLQALLDSKASNGLSKSLITHLRWDLKQIFRLAIADGLAVRNPAEDLFTPRSAQTTAKRFMNLEQVGVVLSLFALRERLIVKLAILAGMRPGEIFALRWGRLREHCAEIQERVYRGDLDSPKTATSVRDVALGDDLLADTEKWRQISLDKRAEAWVFPSERMVTPISKDNCWRRNILPKLKEAGLGWANFQVMRRTHSSLLNELKVRPKVVADQLGHSVDVNQNVYTRSSLSVRKEAVNSLEGVIKKSRTTSLNDAQMTHKETDEL
jgi:integrase